MRIPAQAYVILPTTSTGRDLWELGFCHDDGIIREICVRYKDGHIPASDNGPWNFSDDPYHLFVQDELVQVIVPDHPDYDRVAAFAATMAMGHPNFALVEDLL